MLLHFGNLRGIFIYTAEIPPSHCYGAALQFDSLCSLRMTKLRIAAKHRILQQSLSLSRNPIVGDGTQAVPYGYIP